MTEDESVPVHEGPTRHPLVVFGDHQLCAGERLDVRRMSGPHMHSQVEINYILEGRISYWFDGHHVELAAGQLCLFWGMVPHQVTEVSGTTRFVCLYMPMGALTSLHGMADFRDAMFGGGLIEALHLRDFDREIFSRWREELLSGDEELAQIVRGELIARIRRIGREGWRDLRLQGSALATARHHDGDRLPKVEIMLRYIAEHALRPITMDDVGRAAGLHPNYAMTLFRNMVGMTINQTIIRHRLDTAQSLLISSSLPIVAIAFESGFGSQSRFYEAFQARFLTTPARYRHDRM